MSALDGATVRAHEPVIWSGMSWAGAGHGSLATVGRTTKRRCRLGQDRRSCQRLPCDLVDLGQGRVCARLAGVRLAGDIADGDHGVVGRGQLVLKPRHRRLQLSDGLTVFPDPAFRREESSQTPLVLHSSQKSGTGSPPREISRSTQHDMSCCKSANGGGSFASNSDRGRISAVVDVSGIRNLQ
jgi:hypothetical protein